MKLARRELIAHDVASAIRDQILSREVKPGEILRLAPLAERLGTSITPVREALLMLAQDGWVGHEPNRGFRVVPVRRDNVIDTYFMWATAEGELAARATSRVTAGQISTLRAIDGRLHAQEDHNTRAALNLNAEFHTAVHIYADAPKLLWFADAARRLVPLQFNSSFHEIPGWEKINRFGHTPIVDCIADSDVGGARKLMSEHFLSTCDLLIEWLDSLSFWDASPRN